MLEILSKIPDLCVRSQQNSESDLTNEEKFDALRHLFVQSPLQFLTRFGEQLQKQPELLGCFEEIEDEDVDACLKLMRKNISGKLSIYKAK